MPATFLPIVLRDEPAVADAASASASASASYYHRSQPFALAEDGKSVWTYKNALYSPDAYEGLEVSLDFTLADLEPGKCVVGGFTTRGCLEFGVYYGHTSGRYLHFDGSQQGSLLWNGFVLVRGPLADANLEREARRQKWLDKVHKKFDAMKAAGENTDCCGTPTVSDDEDGPLYGPPMKRTDSGTNYGFTGYPDVEFWARSGIIADAFVPSEVYTERDQQPVAEMDDHLLCYYKKRFEEHITHLRHLNKDGISPAFQAAINKQAGEMTARLEALSAEATRRRLEF